MSYRCDIAIVQDILHGCQNQFGTCDNGSFLWHRWQYIGKAIAVAVAVTTTVAVSPGSTLGMAASTATAVTVAATTCTAVCTRGSTATGLPVSQRAQRFHGYIKARIRGKGRPSDSLEYGMVVIQNKQARMKATSTIKKR